MHKIYTHENIVIIHNLRNILEQDGISCLIRNDIVSAGVGEVPPIEVWPEIWIEDGRYIERANKLVHDAVHGDPSKTSWFCEDCGETNAPAFEICWKCGREA